MSEQDEQGMNIYIWERLDFMSRYYHSEGGVVLSPLRQLKGVYHAIKLAWQRARHGIDDSMMWSLDAYLTNHIHELLVRYLKDAEGVVDLDTKTGELTDREFVTELIRRFETFQNVREQTTFITLEAREEAERSSREKLKMLFDPQFESLWY